MLEIRYNTKTKELTAWCGDEKQFGNLAREGHTVVVLDIPIPDEPPMARLFDGNKLIPNPDYVEPELPRNPLIEIDNLKAEIEKLKG